MPHNTQKPSLPPLPGASVPEDTQPTIATPPLPSAQGQFATGGFAAVRHHTGAYPASHNDLPEADEAPTLPPELMPPAGVVAPPYPRSPHTPAQPPGLPSAPQPPAQPPTHATGQFSAVGPGLDPFMTGRHQAISQTQPGYNLSEAFGAEPDRVSYGIWGAAVGAIIGILFGVLNALFEGVYPSDNQGPLIIFTLLGLSIGGVLSAAAPQKMAGLIRELFFFYR